MDLSRVVAFEPTAAEGEAHEAAVLVPVVERDDEPHLLFIKRADHLGEHPGQMAFPGGGREPRDETIFETAVREAEEEVGLRPDEVVLVGRLDDIRTITRYTVTPFVARAPDRTYVPDGREVAEIALLSVPALVDLDNYESQRRVHPTYGEARIHFFHVDGYTVWGATANILVQLLELTTDWRMPTEVDQVVEWDPDD